MKKKALVAATVIGFIANFEYNDILILQSMGYEVHVAANMSDCNNKDKLNRLLNSGIIPHDIKFCRNPFKAGNIEAYQQLEGLIKREKYDILHCHTPVAGVFARIAGHKCRVNHVIYTAHGFHFFKGAPKINWIMYYPIEKFLSKWTDTLITINKEDYNRAKKQFHARRTQYIPGIGVDTQRFAQEISCNTIRKEFGISESEFMLLSVGRLDANKNHEVVVRAIKDIENLCYVIVGEGELHDRLKAVASETGVKLILPGYRKDVARFYKAADAYILPSKREGLNVSLMEAMASGLPCLCGNIRGNTDLVDEAGGFVFNPTDINGINECIKKIIDNQNRKELGVYNQKKIRDFDISVVENRMREYYEEAEASPSRKQC